MIAYTNPFFIKQMTLTKTTFNQITVQLQVPINIEVEIEGKLTEKSILDAVWDEMKRIGSSHNSWSPSYGDIKEVVRGACFCKETFDDDVKEGFLIAYVD